MVVCHSRTNHQVGSTSANPSEQDPRTDGLYQLGLLLNGIAYSGKVYAGPGTTSVASVACYSRGSLSMAQNWSYQTRNRSTQLADIKTSIRPVVP